MSEEIKQAETDHIEFNQEVDTTVEQAYTDSDIQVLEGLEAVRKRPGMYIASTSAKGLHHLVWEIVDNSIDEALAGIAHTISITVDKDNVVTVEDDGRGMPVGINQKTKISTVETIFTVLHAGGKFGGGAYKVSGGLHGVGASVVNALSAWLEVTVYHQGKIYFVRFENGGHAVEPLHKIGTCEPDKHGSKVAFKADPLIFTETTVYDHDTLRDRLRQYAFLNKGVRIIFNDERMDDPEKAHHVFHYAGGLKEYVAYLNKNRNVIEPDIIYSEGMEDNIGVEIAMQYNDGYNPNIYTFCNNVSTGEGGTHEEGFRLALGRVLNKYARDNGYIKKDEDNLSSDDVREGLTAIVSVKHPNPQYEGQTKTKLGNTEVRKIVSDVFGAQLERFLLEHPDEAKAIMDKCALASKARLAAKKARELTRRKSALEISSLPGKLADCSSKDASICEIYLVEGDSAGGSATQGRDSRFQAILPLWGKMLNVEKARADKVYGNDKLSPVITALGAGIGDEFNLDKLRYHKVIIMADADVDGSHIRTLLLTFFFRFMRPLIERGYVYSAVPPLYKLTRGKSSRVAFSDDERDRISNELRGGNDNVKIDISRYKGLGEMNPHELWETTMDPETRTLRRITLEDAAAADQIFTVLMGEDVEPRKEFIEENAKYVVNLDI